MWWMDKLALGQIFSQYFGVFYQYDSGNASYSFYSTCCSYQKVKCDLSRKLPKATLFRQSRNVGYKSIFTSVPFTPFIPHSLQIHIAHSTWVIWLLNEFTECLSAVCLATEHVASVRTLFICWYRAGPVTLLDGRPKLFTSKVRFFIKL